MANNSEIAILSVSDKTGVVDAAKRFHAMGLQLYGSGRVAMGSLVRILKWSKEMTTF